MEKKKRKKFLKIPVLEGGNPEFRKFIETNLRYPDAALKNKTEGVVHLSYDVDDTGFVCNVKVVKGIGSGCDEEAIRLVGMLTFTGVNNRGTRLRIAQKAKINFKLPVTKQEPVQITWHYIEKKDKEADNSYNYTVKL